MSRRAGKADATAVNSTDEEFEAHPAAARDQYLLAFLPEAAGSWRKVHGASKLHPDAVIPGDVFAHRIGLAVEAELKQRLSGNEVLVVFTAASGKSAALAGLLRGSLPSTWLNIHRGDTRLPADQQGDPASALVSQLADLMVSAFPADVEPNEMADLVGPFYDTKGVCAVLGISRQAVSDRRQSRRSLLAMQTSDGEWIYPVFQFGHGSVRPDLRLVLSTLKVVDSWTIGVWLRTPSPDLDELTPEAWLSRGNDAAVVERLAEHLVQQWAA